VNNESYTFAVFFSFFLIFNGFLPLDLAVGFTIVKLFYVGRLALDTKMIDEERSLQTGQIEGCKVKNLETLQDFSLVNNIFCDKTGTLTKNILVFKKFSVMGQVLDRDMFKSIEEYSKGIQEAAKMTKEGFSEQFLNFFRCLVICHDVIQVRVRDSKDEEQYSGASQDEVTFLEMCKRIGFARFVERDSNVIKIEIDGKTE
jgi:magnesium-transporting ATPase (P-type)